MCPLLDCLFVCLLPPIARALIGTSRDDTESSKVRVRTASFVLQIMALLLPFLCPPLVRPLFLPITHPVVFPNMTYAPSPATYVLSPTTLRTQHMFRRPQMLRRHSSLFHSSPAPTTTPTRRESASEVGWSLQVTCVSRNLVFGVLVVGG